MLTKVKLRDRAPLFFWLIGNGLRATKMALKTYGWLMDDWSSSSIVEMQRSHFFGYLSYGWEGEHKQEEVGHD